MTKQASERGVVFNAENRRYVFRRKKNCHDCYEAFLILNMVILWQNSVL